MSFFSSIFVSNIRPAEPTIESNSESTTLLTLQCQCWKRALYLYFVCNSEGEARYSAASIIGGAKRPAARLRWTNTSQSTCKARTFSGVKSPTLS